MPELKPEWTWQRQGEDEWVFGVPVRGIIRNPVAEVYFDEDCDGPEGGWRWLANEASKCGTACSLAFAVEAAEQAIREWEAEK